MGIYPFFTAKGMDKNYISYGCYNILPFFWTLQQAPSLKVCQSASMEKGLALNLQVGLEGPGIYTHAHFICACFPPSFFTILPPLPFHLPSNSLHYTS
jgi:hypothetical protein